jgi:hypothetical protein
MSSQPAEPLEPLAWKQFDREQIRRWIEEASGEGLSVGDPLPDSLAATAENLGMLPVELRMWVYEQPRYEWRAVALERWARRYGFDRTAPKCGHCGGAVGDPKSHKCAEEAHQQP